MKAYDETPTMAPERMAYFEGLPVFVRNAIAVAMEGDWSGDTEDALGWIAKHKEMIRCSADILTDRDWATLNHLDAFENELREALAREDEA
jgi:hypothetical protein